MGIAFVGTVEKFYVRMGITSALSVALKQHIYEEDIYTGVTDIIVDPGLLRFPEIAWNTTRFQALAVPWSKGHVE